MPRQLVASQSALSSNNSPNHSTLIYGTAEPASVTGTASETTLASIVLPADIMGSNGVIRVHMKWSVTNSANTKNLRCRINGQICHSYSVTTSAIATVEFLFSNRNSKVSQITGPNFGGGFGAQGNAYVTQVIDTAQVLTIDFTGQLATTTESITFEQAFIEVFPSN